MPIGTSEGQYFEGPLEFRMASQAPTEPAGAFKSSGGTEPPDNSADIQKAYLEKLSGTPNPRPAMDIVTDYAKNKLTSIYEALKLPGDAWQGKIDPMSTQGLEKANTLAGLMVGGPAPVAAKMADGTLGSFAGVSSKTLNKEALYKAQNAELEGVHPDQIWQDTGFFRGADNRWRYEISDENALLRGKGVEHDVIKGKSESTDRWSVGGSEDQPIVSIKDVGTDFFGKPKDPHKLPDVLHHPELYEAYPELKQVKVAPLPELIEMVSPTTKGMFSYADNTIYLKPGLDPDYAKSVILHEMQHKIQDTEKFALGGNPQQFLTKELQEATNKFQAVRGETESSIVEKYKLSDKDLKSLKRSLDVEADGGISPGADKWKGRIHPEDLSSMTDIVKGEKLLQQESERQFEKYQRLMGEVEARNTQTRMNFTDIARNMHPPHATEDRPRFVQIDANTKISKSMQSSEDRPMAKAANDNSNIKTKRDEAFDALSKYVDTLNKEVGSPWTEFEKAKYQQLKDKLNSLK